MSHDLWFRCRHGAVDPTVDAASVLDREFFAP
jgi:hypothetical protein